MSGGEGSEKQSLFIKAESDTKNGLMHTLTEEHEYKLYGTKYTFYRINSTNVKINKQSQYELM